jgi:hypothetical protein
MLADRASIKVRATLALTALTVFMPFASGQSPTTRPGNSDKENVVAQGSGLGNPKNEVDSEPPKASDLESEVADVKAENAAFREALRKMDEQQRALLGAVERLQRKLDGNAVENLTRADLPVGSLQPVIASAAPAVPASTPVASTQATIPVPAPQTNHDRYRDGIIIWETRENAEVPFLLRLQGTTQVRYLNTLDSNDTFTDHLGVTRDVNKRNDITVNRSMMVFGGYIFDKRAQYSFTIWTSAGAASIVVAGNIGWRFSKAFTLTGGYFGVPGSRSLIGTFPFFTANDRTMADNFFRPGFTQGAVANGQLVKGLNYLAMVGNGLNTLNVAASKIDTNLLVSGSLWWEPLGDYGPPGRSRNMSDDYFSSRKVRIRLGTSFTRSRENRFSDLDQSSPENTSIYNSDGVQAFATGAFAPGVTLQDATYKMSAIDFGIKWNGLAVNGQYFMRWLNDFVADGPLPLASTFDHGAELSASYFVKPKKLMPYVRASWVRGQFANPYEYGAGLRWYYLRTERLWLNAEVFHINGAPYSGTFTPYTAGMTGWAPMVQAYIAF